jgi:hypothetical protein
MNPQPSIAQTTALSPSLSKARGGLRRRATATDTRSFEAICLVFLLLAFVVRGAEAQCKTSWNIKTGKTGYWVDSSNWDKGVPKANTDACIDIPAKGTNKGGNARLFGARGDANNLTIGKDNSLTLIASQQKNALLELSGNTLDNSGTITFNAVVGATKIPGLDLLTNKEFTLKGTGKLILATEGSLIDTFKVKAFVNESNIEGQGEIFGSNETQLIENRGTINANRKGVLLIEGG